MGQDVYLVTECVEAKSPLNVNQIKRGDLT